MAELFGDLLADAADVRFNGLLAGFAGGTVCGIERGKGRGEALGGVGGRCSGMDFSLAAKILKRFAGGGLDGGAGFGDVGFQLE